jgi:hypothetical protein
VVLTSYPPASETMPGRAHGVLLHQKSPNPDIR